MNGALSQSNRNDSDEVSRIVRRYDCALALVRNGDAPRNYTGELNVTIICPKYRMRCPLDRWLEIFVKRGQSRVGPP